MSKPIHRLTKLPGLGLTDDQVAGVFDVTRDSINDRKKDKRFFLHLKGGKDEANEKVVKKPKCSCSRKKALRAETCSICAAHERSKE